MPYRQEQESFCHCDRYEVVCFLLQPIALHHSVLLAILRNRPHLLQKTSSEGVSTCWLYLLSFNFLDIKTNRSETIITTYHCTIRVFHPTIVKISFSSCKGCYKLAHCFPCFRAKTLRTKPINANPRLTFSYITSVFYGIFVFCHQGIILHLTNSCYLYLHLLFLSLSCVNC